MLQNSNTFFLSFVIKIFLFKVDNIDQGMSLFQVSLFDSKLNLTRFLLIIPFIISVTHFWDKIIGHILERQFVQ